MMPLSQSSWRWPRLALIALLILAITGCARSAIRSAASVITPTKGVSLVKGKDTGSSFAFDLSPIREGRLSELSRHYLWRYGIDLKQSREQLFKQVHAKLRRDPTLELRYLAAEISYSSMLHAEENAEEWVVPWALLTAAHSLEMIKGCYQCLLDPRVNIAQDFYNQAIERWAKATVSQHPVWSDQYESPVGAPTYYVWHDEIENSWAADYFDELLVARDFSIDGFKDNYQRFGLGAPLVGLRENRIREPYEEFLPPEGITRPVTAFLWFAIPPELQTHLTGTAYFINSRASEDFKDGERQYPVAADFTTPYAYLLSEAKLENLGNVGLLDYQATQDHLGIYFLEEYDPNKTPVLMIHGLRSSPLIWRELTQSIQSNPEFSEKFQVWHFSYPTAAPFLYSAGVLRQQLQRVLFGIDPENDDYATNNIILIGHSMGGLLSKALVSQSGSELWDLIFTKPLGQLDISDEDARVLRQMFFLQPEPAIKRVVFMETPHGGSTIAKAWFARVTSSVIALPQQFQNTVKNVVNAQSENIIEEAYTRLARNTPNSIRTLRSDNPQLVTFRSLPIAPRVPYHSIIGNDPDGPADVVTDSVVPYESAHIKGALSELVVSSKHDAYDNPRAIMEIHRILKEHLFESQFNQWRNDDSERRPFLSPIETRLRFDADSPSRF